DDPKLIENPDAPVRISLVAMQLMVWGQGDLTREPIRSSPRAYIETVALNCSSDPHQWVQAEIKIGSRTSYPLVGRVGRGTGQQIAGHFRTWAFSATDLTDASVGAYVNA